MNIAAVQLDSVWEDPRANFAKVTRLLDTTPPAPGSLVVLPEMFATGFSLDRAATCGDAARETEPFLRDLARQHRATLVAGITSPSGNCARNEAVAFSPDGEILARYVKQRPFSGAGEDTAHERGTGPVCFDWAGLRVA